MDSQNSRPAGFVILLLALPALIYLVLVQIYAFNFPFLDDYATVLVHSVQTMGDQIKAWFVPHNEHIHLIVKAVVSFDLWIFGEVNLTRQIWVGALVFLLFYWKFLKDQREEDLPWIWLIPLPFILFQPSYWGTITWSTTSLHNFPGLLFAWFAIRLWSSPDFRQKMLAMVLTGLALLTNGFGLAVLGTLILWSLFEYWKTRKTSPSFSKTLFIALGIISLGWVLFRISLGELNLQANIDGNSPTEYAHFLTNFLGSCFHFLGSPWLNILAVLQCVLLFLLFRKGLHKSHPTLFYFIIYLLLSALLTTIARTDLGPKQGLASRYRIYSTLLLCCTYLAYAHMYWRTWDVKKRALPILFAASAIFYTTSLAVNVNNLNKIKNRLMADQQRWYNGEPIQEYLNPRDARLILDEASQVGTFPKENP
ncbi:MAG: hypothetical protein P8L44_00370 [Opitutales bacterium]|nr:hypothetical protein [Opitutales bacterium]